MNDNILPNSTANAPWLTSDQPMPVPETSMSPDSEKAAPVAIGLLNTAVQGAHNTIDRIAESAAPAARQLGDSVAAARETLHAKADQLRVTRDEWAESARTTVRGNPLVFVAAAFALGAVISRLLRTSERRNG